MRKDTSTNFLNEKGLIESCGMYYTLSLFGGRWKISILASLLQNEALRYSEIKNRIGNISERMLTKQLKELQHDGLILRKDYAQIPLRVEYQISEKGKSLQRIFIAMQNWAQEHKETRKKTSQPSQQNNNSRTTAKP